MTDPRPLLLVRITEMNTVKVLNADGVVFTVNHHSDLQAWPIEAEAGSIFLTGSLEEGKTNT